MKIDMTTVLTNLEGKPLRDGTGETERDFTLLKACTEALMAVNPNENPDGTEKFRRFKLCLKITGEDTPDLTAEEIVTLKKVIGMGFGSLVVGRAYELLDPTPSAG